MYSPLVNKVPSATKNVSDFVLLFQSTCCHVSAPQFWCFCVYLSLLALFMHQRFEFLAEILPWRLCPDFFILWTGDRGSKRFLPVLCWWLCWTSSDFKGKQSVLLDRVWTKNILPKIFFSLVFFALLSQDPVEYFADLKWMNGHKLTKTRNSLFLLFALTLPSDLSLIWRCTFFHKQNKTSNKYISYHWSIRLVCHLSIF